LCVIGRDSAGNDQAAVTSFTWVKDTAPPASATLSGTPADPSNATTLNVDVGGTGINDYKYDVLDAAAADCSGAAYGGYISASTNITDAIGADDSYRLCVIGRDTAGNDQAAATSYAWVKDTAPPSAFDVTGPAALTNDDTPTVTWSAATGAATYDLVVDNNADCASPLQTYLAETGTSKTLTTLFGGTYYICVVAKDGVPNVVNATTYPTTITIDAQAPNTPAAPTDAGTYSGTTVTFNWSSVTDNGTAGVASYHLQVGTTAGGNNVLDQDVGNVLTYNIAGSGGVTYFARVKAVDAAGNPGTYSGNSNGVMVDATAPTGASALKVTADDPGGALTTLDNDTTFYMVWTAGSDDHSGLDATSPYEVIWYATADCSGTANSVPNITATNYALNAPNVVDGGVYSFKVKTNDKATNNVTSGCSGSMSIDTTGPSVTVNQAGGQADPTADVPVNFTVVFS
jgi:hypothetical protein